MPDVRGVDGIDLDAEGVGLVVEGVRHGAIVGLRAEEEAVDPARLDVLDALDAGGGEVVELFGLAGVGSVAIAQRVADDVLAVGGPPSAERCAELREQLPQLVAVGGGRVVVDQALGAALAQTAARSNWSPYTRRRT
jgi:hypothetical protein